MEVYFDMEFTGLHQGTTPISLGMCTKDGRTFYGEFSDYSRDQLDDWLRENVVSHLRMKSPRRGENEHYMATRHGDNPKGRDLYSGYSVELRGTKSSVSSEALRWLGQFGDQVVMHGDVLGYDWVLFCELFGGALHVPSVVYYIPVDLASVLKAKKKDPDVSREKMSGLGLKGHNALNDALMIMACFQKLGM